MSVLTAWFAAALKRCNAKQRCDERGCPNTATDYDAALDFRSCELHTYVEALT